MRAARVAIAAAAALLLAASPDPARAAEADAGAIDGAIDGTTPRERVGLVLGGGSARGLAHIGVVRGLERLRVPVDAVAGSSMGSVVGALYAAGYTGHEMAELAVALDWTSLFDDSTVRERATFRRKSDDVGFLADGYFAFADGALVLPDGVVQGQSLWLALSTLLADARGVTDFDALPIPFRAVAMDLSTGGVVVLNAGDLAEATLASMALPGLIPPVEIDGRRLIDGGFIDNLPVSTARDMGSERTIVVSVGSDPLPVDSIAGFSGVLRQVQKLLTDPSVRAQRGSLTETDVLIEPELDEFGFASFADAATLIGRGERAVERLASELAPLALDERAWSDHLASRARIKAARPTVRAVAVDQDGGLSDALVRRFLSVDVGAPLDPEALGDDIEDLYATGLFERIGYDLDADGLLTLRARGYPAERGFFRLGAGLESDLDDDTRFAFGISYTKPQVNRRGGEYRLKTTLGDVSRLAGEFHQPFGRSLRAFVEPSLRVANGRSTFFDDGDVLAGTERSGIVRGGLDAGLLFGRWGELRVGVGYAASELEPATDPDALEPADAVAGPPGPSTVRDASAFVQLAVDTLDELAWPHVGAFGAVRHTRHADVAGADLDYAETELTALKPFTRGATTLALRAGASISSGADADAVTSARLGGFLELSGFAEDERRGRHSLLFSGTVYRRVNARSILFDLPIYVGGSLEAGDAFEDRDDVGLDALTVAGSAFVGLDSPIGPVYLGYGRNDADAERFYFTIGSFVR